MNKQDLVDHICSLYLSWALTSRPMAAFDELLEVVVELALPFMHQLLNMYLIFIFLTFPLVFTFLAKETDSTT